MKKLLLIFMLFVAWTAAKAQDKIITTKHYTIECRILSVSADQISYEQKTSDNQLVKKSISTSEVLKYHRAGKYETINGRSDLENAGLPEHRWLFSIQGGLSHSLTDYDNSKNALALDNSSASVNDYFGKLTNGYHLSSSVHYLLSSSFGLGVDYNLFYTASKGEFMYRNYPYGSAYGEESVAYYLQLKLDEKIYSHFVGASLLFQQFADKKRKIKISETISPGIVLLRNESRDYQYQGYGGYGYGYGSLPYYDYTNSITTGTTFGAKGSLAVEYALTPQLSAGLAGNFMWAELHKISVKYAYTEVHNQELQKSTNLSHIDYGFIVRYNF